MRYAFPLALAVPLLTAPMAPGYIEAPHTLGRCCHESTNVVLVEITRLDKTKNLIIYKKVEDLKGRHPDAQIKHNIGQRGYHAREWQTIMAWAEVGKKAVFFHNGGASVTCIGKYWYQCFKEGEWWGMTHAEPVLLRTYCGDAEKLAGAVRGVVQGREVVIPCLVEASREQLQQGKGKLQRLKASLKRLDYNVKRDFVGLGAGEGEEQFDRIVLLAASTSGWKYLPAAKAAGLGERWRALDFNDAAWRSGKAPLGYGEAEIAKRSGTTVAERGTPFLFRRALDVSEDLLTKKGVTFQLFVASDNGALVYLNGQAVDEDAGADHEYQYWNREVRLGAKQLRPGRNMIAVFVNNTSGSSDLYLDLEVSAEVPLTAVKSAPSNKEPLPGQKMAAKNARHKEPPLPASRIETDKQKRTVAISGTIARRKLPHLKETYPIEVVATDAQGQKAHETVVAFSGIKPSDVHKALTQIGLKPGKPGRGEVQGTGPEVRVFVEVGAAEGKPRRLPLEQTLVDHRSGRPPTRPVKFHFTGSALRQPDPEKNERVYGADVTGTFVTLFPVSDDTVLQSNLTPKDESLMKLETNKNVLPKEGSPARLVIEAVR